MAMPSVCRVCLSDNLPLHNLTINNLTQIYEKLTNIQYNKDGYPLSMCYLCLLVLRRCYRFKETARDSDKVLQQWYKKQSEHKVFKARPLFNLTTSDVSLDLNVKSEAAVAEARQIKQENIDDDAEKEIYLEVEKPAEETNNIEYTLETLSTDNIVDSIDFDHSDSDNETKPFQNIDRQQTRSVKNEKEDSGCKKTEETNICPMNEKPGCSKSIRNAPKSGTRPVKTIRDAGPEDTSPTIITTVKIKKEKKQTRKTHPCPICHIRFLYLRSVKRHVSLEHNGEKPFACDVCDFKTVHKQYLKKHQFLHSMDDNDKPYACDLCDLRTAYKYSLKEHRKTHFNDERKYPCHVCNLRFFNKHKLKSHLQTHTKDKPFLCDLCAFKSKYQSSLDYHVKAAHSAEKTLLLQCSSCDKKFANQLCLRQHTKRIHNSVKAYSCDLCDYKGVDKADLRNHSTRHSDERPYECHLCDMKFKKRYTLKNHVRTHTGEKPFTCNLCDFKCSQKGSLNVHLKRHTAK